MGIKLISNEYDLGVRTETVDGTCDVQSEVSFGACGTNRRLEDLAGGDIEICDQALRTVANIFKLTKFDATTLHRASRSCALQRLDAGLFVGTENMGPGGLQVARLAIQIAKLSDLFVELCGIFRAIIVEPISTAMGLKLCLPLKNAPHVWS